MAAIIRGTTPTITFTFSEIAVADISTAYLTIRQGCGTVIEKDLSTASVGEDSLTWTLSQTETLLLRSKTPGEVVCDWKLADGTRGRSKVLQFTAGEPGKNEVI